MKKKNKKSTDSAVMPSAKSEKEYMAEDDMRTMMRAEEIKMDRQRMKSMMAAMGKQAKVMSHVMALKQHIKKSK